MPNHRRYPDPEIGTRFRALVVISEGYSMHYGRTVKVECDCGAIKEVLIADLMRGRRVTCGDRKVHAWSRTHGQSGVTGRRAETSRQQPRTGAYQSWASMIQRCTNPNYRRWKDYGGRGIAVCERWRKFDRFFADMGERPPSRTLDRVDNDGDYEPGNCRWATYPEQMQNQGRRPTTCPHCGKAL